MLPRRIVSQSKDLVATGCRAGDFASPECVLLISAYEDSQLYDINTLMAIHFEHL